MTISDVNDQIRQIRQCLANVLVNVSQAQEAHNQEEGAAAPSDIPGLVNQMQRQVARAAVLLAEWDQGYYDGSLPLPGQLELGIEVEEEIAGDDTEE